VFTDDPQESTPGKPGREPEPAARLTPAMAAISFTTILIQVQAAYHGHASDLLPILVAALLALAGVARKSLRATTELSQLNKRSPPPLEAGFLLLVDLFAGRGVFVAGPPFLLLRLLPDEEAHSRRQVSQALGNQEVQGLPGGKPRHAPLLDEIHDAWQPGARRVRPVLDTRSERRRNLPVRRDWAPLINFCHNHIMPDQGRLLAIMSAHGRPWHTCGSVPSMSLDYCDQMKAELQKRFPGWNIWYVPCYGGTVTWCAQPLPVINSDSPEHLAEEILHAHEGAAGEWFALASRDDYAHHSPDAKAPEEHGFMGPVASKF
jgi:hypothetical protein